MKKIVNSALKKAKFLLSIEPIILKKDRSYIPEKYRSVVLISADFELAFSLIRSKKISGKSNFIKHLAERERNNIQSIVFLCEKHQIPITWAIVGHLFLDKCERNDGVVHPEIPPVPAYQGQFWDFQGGDWFEHDPCTSLSSNSEWYAPDLIQHIISSPIKHEIGCHTFSHIDCRNSVCPPELMRAELQACKRLAGELNLKLLSFVHPGHTIGNLDVLASEGFTNFRTDYRNVLGYPKKHSNGLWELEQTMELRYYDLWSIDYQVKRYTTIIKRAIKSNTVCVLWFHPSFNSIFVDKVLPEVFRFIDNKRDSIWVTTHSEYVDFLNK